MTVKQGISEGVSDWLKKQNLATHNVSYAARARRTNAKIDSENPRKEWSLTLRNGVVQTGGDVHCRPYIFQHSV